MNEHTPELELFIAKSDAAQTWLRAKGGERFIHVTGKGHDDVARLIAAAPEMLEALKQVVAISSDGHDTISFLTELHRVAVVCAGAIRKATA